MAFTVSDFQDLLRLLEQQPEWRAQMRSVILTDELLALPDLVRSLIEAQRRTEEAQERTERELTELAHEVRDLAAALRAVAIRVDKLDGSDLERHYREHAPAYFGGIVRRSRVLSGYETEELLEGAFDRGDLTRAEYRDVTLADAIIRGLTWGDRRQVYLVAEVSVTVGNEDVERAGRRAAVLAKAGVETIPVVAGQRMASGVPRRAAEAGVWRVTNGKTVSPEGIEINN